MSCLSTGVSGVNSEEWQQEWHPHPQLDVHTFKCTSLLNLEVSTFKSLAPDSESGFATLFLFPVPCAEPVHFERNNLFQFLVKKQITSQTVSTKPSKNHHLALATIPPPLFAPTLKEVARKIPPRCNFFAKSCASGQRPKASCKANCAESSWTGRQGNGSSWGVWLSVLKVAFYHIW